MSERKQMSLQQVMEMMSESQKREEVTPEEALDMQIDLQLAYLDRYRNWKDAATDNNYGYLEGGSKAQKSELDKTAEELITRTIAKIEALAIERRKLIQE